MFIVFHIISHVLIVNSNYTANICDCTSFVELSNDTDINGAYMMIRRCEADPSALANYVVALVKKDKPEKELKALCADQLDVFLQKGSLSLHSALNG